jgi:hypothetical protein
MNKKISKRKPYPYAMMVWQSVISPDHNDDMPDVKRILRKLVRDAVMAENREMGGIWTQHEMGGIWTQHKARQRANKIAKELVP